MVENGTITASSSTERVDWPKIDDKYDKVNESIRKVTLRLKGEGFTRFHSKKCILVDCFNINLGAPVYAIVLYCLWNSTTWNVLILLFLLSVSCFWPNWISKSHPEIYLRWRDAFFSIHFLIHHVFAGEILRSHGMDPRGSINGQFNPVLMFVLYLFTSPIGWHAFHALISKPARAVRFVIVQSALLYFVTGHEAVSCRSILSKNPAIAARAFKTIFAALRSVESSVTSLSIGMPLDTSDPVLDELEGYAECKHIMIFLLYFFVIALPAFFHSRAEKVDWEEFLQSSVENISWEDGPSRNEISAALNMLKADLAYKQERWAAIEAFHRWPSMLACALVLWVCIPYLPVGPKLWN